MRVFISWSGKRSHAVATIMAEWIKLVVQASKPWMSSHEIESGSGWDELLHETLNESSVGVICLTPENRTAPWILYEAGMIAKGQKGNRVCPILIGLDKKDVEPPLSRFQLTMPVEDEMWKLIKMINSGTGDNRLEESTLKKAFDTYWPKFEKDYREASKSVAPEVAANFRSQDEILAEILEMTRSLSFHFGQLEGKLTYFDPYLRDEGGTIIRESSGRLPGDILSKAFASNLISEKASLLSGIKIQERPTGDITIGNTKESDK